jgi:hypothetical protein
MGTTGKPIKGISLVPIKEVEKLGLDFDIYDYEADITIDHITLLKCRIVDEYAFKVNDAGTHMVVIKVTEPNVIIQKTNKKNIN